MQVFKQYFKIIRRSTLPVIILYVGIFFMITVVSTTANTNNISETFKSTQCSVAVINKDNSTVSTKLTEYINDNSKPVEVKDDEQSQKDALFFRVAEVIVTIPDGFGDSILTDNPKSIEFQNIPDSASSTLIKTMINNYIGKIRLYNDGTKDMSIDQMISNVENDLNKTSTVTFSSGTEKNNESRSALNSYFDYLSYPLLAIMIFCISSVLTRFNIKDLKRRNLCSPISTSSFNIQILLGNAVLTLIIWLLFIILAAILYKDALFTTTGLLYSITSLLFAIVSLALSFMIGSVASKNAINPIANIISLGSSFLCGVFVPQAFLSDTVKSIASFIPTYWYVKANDSISTLSTFTSETLRSVQYDVLIVIAFTAVFIAISLVASKQKRFAE